MLFFELRGVEVSCFIDVSLKDHVDTLLEHADIEKVFDVYNLRADKASERTGADIPV